jgi:G3E family GTPase
MERRGAFDYVLLETTGLADPGNIAPLFWVDEGLGSTIYLDGIVTLVDAKNILKSLDEPPPETVHHDEPNHHIGPELTTAHLQISHADVAVVNKSDLVNEDDLRRVQERIRAINSLAKIHVTSHSKIPQLEGVLLDLHAYDAVKADELEFAAKGHSHLDPSISTLALSVPPLKPRDLERLDMWLRSVLWDAVLPSLDADSKVKFEIHRVKGRVVFSDSTVRLIQGVRDVFEILEDKNSADYQESIEQHSLSYPGKLVLIGRGIDDLAFQDSWTGFLGGR